MLTSIYLSRAFPIDGIICHRYYSMRIFIKLRSRFLLESIMDKIIHTGKCTTSFPASLAAYHSASAVLRDTLV